VSLRVDLNGRRALVTGAAKGIGRAIAFELARNGASVIANDLVEADETCDAIRSAGGSAEFVKADISDAAQVEEMVTRVEKDYGPISILINNAGVNLGKERQPLHRFRDEDWDRIVSIDLNGTFYCARSVSSRMVQRKAGAIVNISSVLGIVPARMQCAFTAAKAGVINLTRSQALELGPEGIRVNAIAPGSILTDGTRSLFYNDENRQRSESLISHIPLGHPGEAEDIAYAVLYLVSDAAKYVTGHVMVVDGGWTAGYSRDW
jgi:NAD(P)-dependent dehydrogenase (short-subunit alcohol dehydrogenase family)